MPTWISCQSDGWTVAWTAGLRRYREPLLRPFDMYGVRVWQEHGVGKFSGMARGKRNKACWAYGVAHIHPVSIARTETSPLAAGLARRGALLWYVYQLCSHSPKSYFHLPALAYTLAWHGQDDLNTNFQTEFGHSLGSSVDDLYYNSGSEICCKMLYDSIHNVVHNEDEVLQKLQKIKQWSVKKKKKEEVNRAEL